MSRVPAINNSDVPSVPKNGRKRTALVFAGAGAKIIVALGMAKAFMETGLPWDYAFGTSSGAILAAGIHAGQLSDMEDLMLSVHNKDVYTWAPWKLLTKEACCYDNAPLRKTLKRVISPDRIRQANDTGKICVVNLTDFDDWKVKSVVLSSNLTDDEMIESVLASTAVPCAFPYVNGYADGGIVDNYPLFDALAHKVDRVIMFVTAAVDPKPINNAKDMLAESFSILLYNQLQVALRSLSLFEHDTEVIVIQVPHTTGIPLLNFSGLGSIGQRKHYIDNGYELAKEILKDIKP